MCEWSGHNVRVNMECASRAMCVSKCASEYEMCEFEYSDVQVVQS